MYSHHFNTIFWQFIFTAAVERRNSSTKFFLMYSQIFRTTQIKSEKKFEKQSLLAIDRSNSNYKLSIGHYSKFQ